MEAINPCIANIYRLDGNTIYDWGVFMNRLYELSALQRTILDRINDDDAEQAGLESALQAIEGLIEDKANAMVRFVQLIDSETDAIAEEIKRLQARKSARENRADRIKAYLKQQMVEMGKDKITTPLHTISIQNSPPSLKIDEEATIPASYMTIIPERMEPNKGAIKDALKAGKEIEGCRLEVGNHLRIR